MSRFLLDVLNFLIQPLGGYPVGVVEGLPGWHLKLVRGPRRWLGLRPGRALPVADPGPWWTPSGVLHILRSIPTIFWLALLAWLMYWTVNAVRDRLKARQYEVHQQKLLTAAKASDLLLQRNRMLRAFGGLEEAAPAMEVEVDVLEPEIQWQDPSEWDQDTRKQWDDFMRKSKALRIQQERWWDIRSADDVPHFKTAHDKLRDSGSLPSYE